MGARATLVAGEAVAELRDHRLGLSMGFNGTEPVQDACLKLALESWRSGRFKDVEVPEVAELAPERSLLDLVQCPERSQVLVWRAALPEAACPSLIGEGSAEHQ